MPPRPPPGSAPPPRVNTACRPTIFSIKLLYIYNLTTLCLNGTLSCVDFMDVAMGYITFVERVR